MNSYYNKFFILILISLTLSCSRNKEDESFDYTHSKVKMDSVKVNKTTMAVNEIQNIYTYSTIQTECERFYGYDISLTNSFEYNIAIVHSKPENVTCKDATAENKLISSIYRFQPKTAGKYNLKFRVDDNNYLIKQITVQ